MRSRKRFKVVSKLLMVLLWMMAAASQTDAAKHHPPGDFISLGGHPYQAEWIPNEGRMVGGSQTAEGNGHIFPWISTQYSAETTLSACTGNISITGSILYTEPQCSDGSYSISRYVSSTCSSASQELTVHPRPSLLVSECSDKPLRRARVELWQDQTFTDSFIASTVTDQLGNFSFCINNNNPSSSGSLYIRFMTCADGQGNRCGWQDDVPLPFSVVTTNSSNSIYSGYSNNAEICTGTIYWGITDRREVYNGAEKIFDLLANEAIEFLENTVGWSNTFRTQVRFPDTSNTLSIPDGIVHLTLDHQQDQDVILKTYAYFVLFQLYNRQLPIDPGCAGSWGISSSPKCAWVHGWGYFLQGAMKNEPTYEETVASGNLAALHIDMETPVPLVEGRDDEGAVAATLWDMLDGPNEAWDEMGVGLNAMWDVIADAHPDDLCDFYRSYLEFYGGKPVPELNAILSHHKCKCIPVLILPGISGSSLHVGRFDGPELWIGGFPWPESNLERLRYECDAAGCHSVEGNMVPGHIFAFSYGGEDSGIIGELIKELEYKLYDPSLPIEKQPHASLFPCPYDWRKPIGELADDLEAFINSKIRPIYGDSKIDIIAHSMGGLVAKTYIKRYSAGQNIGRLFFVGTPHLGSPAIFQALRYPRPVIPWLPYVLGYRAITIKELARNLPGACDLLPSRLYFLDTGYIRDPLDLDDNGFKRSTNEILDYAQTLHFLKNARERYLPMGPLNADLIDLGQSFHEEMDLFLLPSEIEVHVIAGIGVATPMIITETRQRPILNKPPITIENGQGDGTVPVHSAVSVFKAGGVLYQHLISGARHGSLLKNSSVIQSILQVLKGEDSASLQGQR
jgi:pimeloyl-ACP methyl ester carboxylesterase